MRTGLRTQIIALVIMIALLGASGVLSVAMTGIAGRAKITYTDTAAEGQPPEVTLGIALGAFRGIFVNFLWMRANDMKQDGKFFDAIQLADTITRLQPRFPRVWVFHAWNMAYNISVATQTNEERWDWVNQGIDILRSRGIPANPNDLLLHRELAWIFLHKIGGVADDANPYYKRRLASEWTLVLGEPPARTPETTRDRAKATEAMVAFLQPIASAPTSLEDAIRQEPAVGTLVEALRGIDVQLTRDDLLLRVELLRAMEASPQRAELEQQMPPGQRTRRLRELRADPAFAQAWPVLLNTVRRRILVEDYRMEPSRMIRYTRKYGPIDWRHHAAHSLYWSARGVEEALLRVTVANRRDFDFINTDRITVQSVQDLFRSGELYFDFLATMIPGRLSTWQAVPNPHFVDTYGEILEEVRGRSWADRLDNRGFSPLSGGYENFLRDVIVFFYRRNEISMADKYYSQLRNFGGLNLNNPNRVEEMSLPLLEFVQKELRDRVTSPSVAVSQVTAALVGAFTSGLLAGDGDLFRSQFAFAREFHANFFREQGRQTSINPGQFRMEVMDRSFPNMTGALFVQFLATLSLDDQERAYSNAPNDLRQYAFDALAATYREQFDEEAKRGGRPFLAVFPEPEGMPEFRARLRREFQERQRMSPELERK